MFLYICFFFVSFLFSSFLLLLVTYFGQRNSMSRSKSSPFECGFDPQENARLPFSMRFFLLAIIFLIFDIEVVLVFPIILGLMMSRFIMSLVIGLIFMIILMVGLLHEWNEGSLSWIH